MDRREFLSLTPPAALGASAVIKIPDPLPAGDTEQVDVTFDVGVLRVRPGDVVILTAPGCISQDCAARLREHCEALLPGTKWLVMSDGLRVDGVLRGGGQ